jgi:hypothetical protein
MTDTEREARCHAPRATGRPITHIRHPADHRSRALRWRDTVAELVALQADYEAWLDALSGTLQDTATAEALRAIRDLDLGELQSIEPLRASYPSGEGRGWGPLTMLIRRRRNVSVSMR